PGTRGERGGGRAVPGRVGRVARRRAAELAGRPGRPRVHPALAPRARHRRLHGDPAEAPPRVAMGYPVGAPRSPMDRVQTLDIRSWHHRADAGEQAVAIEALERGRVLFLPGLAFALEPGEERFRSPEWSSGSAKNISYDPATGRIGGTRAAGVDAEALRAMMVRFAASTRCCRRPGRPSSRPARAFARSRWPGAPARGGRTTSGCTPTRTRRGRPGARASSGSSPT